MALTLAQGAQLVASTAFRARVRVAMIRAAVAVSSEAQGSLSGAAWAKRRQLATRIITGPDSTLESFAAAVSADPSSALGWWAPVSISSSTNANPSVVTTAAAHGLSTGDVVAITDHATNTAINGSWTVTVLSSVTFEVPWPANGSGGATGTVQKMVNDGDLVFTTNSLFSAVAGLAPGE